MKDRLKIRLESVRMLREQNDITSQDALRYLKSQDYYETLRQQAIANGARNVPFQRELSNVCSNIRIILEYTLDAKNRENGEYIFNRVIDMDYPRALTLFLRNNHPDWEVNTGLFFRDAYKRHSEILSELKLSYNETARHGMQDLVFNLRKIEEVKLWLRNPKDTPFIVDGLLKHPNQLSIEESIFLLGQDTDDREPYNTPTHYHRAKRELSFGKLEVERKLAIQYFLPFCSKRLSQGETFLEIYEDFLDFYGQSITDIPTHFPVFEPDQYLKLKEELKEELSYVLRAVKKNKSFLESFLSN